MKTTHLLYVVVVAIILSGCAQIKKAERLYQGFEYAKAIPVYEKVASKDNKHQTLAYQRLGDISRLSSRFEEAAGWYEKAVATKDVDPEVYINYGQVLRSLGKYAEAIEQFETYMSIKPDDKRAKLFADYCRQFLNKDDLAMFYEVKNVKGLNTSFSDFSPVIVNGQIVFTSDRTSGNGKKYGWTGAYYLDLYKAGLPDENDPEKELSVKPEPFSKELNMTYHDGPASFTADNNTIWFTRVFRKMGDADTTGYFTNKLKIFSSKFDGNKWSQPEPFYLNNDRYSVGHPAISADGKTLYFVSDMPGGKGGTDIYSVELTDGGWSNLRNAGDQINTFGNEMFPVIDKSGNLYFASDGWPGLGSLDIFRSKFIDGEFSKAENLKEPVNSSADDFGFFKSESGYSLFSSNRFGGLGSDDIYMATPIKYADSVLVSGVVKDRNTGDLLANATVLVWDVKSEDVKIIKTGTKGEYSHYVTPGHSYIFKAVKQDYTTDCLTFSVPQYTKNDKHSNRDLLLVKMQIDEVFKLENLYYDFDKYNIRPDAAVELDKLVSFLNQNTSVNVELGSHTDSRGTVAYNEKLAERRAASAVRYIRAKGIAKERIQARGYGETQLVNKCGDNVPCTDEEHQANRRTTIKIIGLAKDPQKENIEQLEALRDGQVIKVSQLSKDFFDNCTDEKSI